GPNGSGKSNLLRALELLGRSAEGKLGRYVQREGGVETLLWDGRADSLRIAAKMSPLPPYDNAATDSLVYELVLTRIGRSSTYRIEREVLENRCEKERSGSTEPFVLLTRDRRRAVIFDMDRQAFEAPDASVPEQETVLSSHQGPFVINRYVSEFREQL